MSIFSDPELNYMDGAPELGRLATVDFSGQPDVVPVCWRYNRELDTIDVGGPGLGQAMRNVELNPKVAFVVDHLEAPDLAKGVQVRGRAQAVADWEAVGCAPPAPIIRVAPARVLSWGVQAPDDPSAEGPAQSADASRPAR